jgi:hypothetical protein
MQMKIESEIAIESELGDICNSLLNVDPDIQEIILFGSFVYAPSLARDIDLLVTTTKRKPYEIYNDAIADFSKNVDLIIKEIGESIGDHFAWGIKSTGHLLKGDGRTLSHLAEINMVTFNRVRKILYRADENFQSAIKAQDEDIKDEAYRDAFNKLFDVARNAVMAYLGSNETRWGQLRRELPDSFNKRFSEIINTLHIAYSYMGNYPKDNAKEEYKNWRKIVEDFLNDLEQDLRLVR